MNKKITVTGANIVFLIVMSLSLVFGIILSIFDEISKGFMDKYTYPILMVNQFILILIPVLFYMFAKDINLKETLRFNKLGVLPALIIVILSVPACLTATVVNNIFLYFIQILGDIPSSPIPVPNTPGDLFIGILVIAITPAICEEILHRGMLLKAYENRGSIKALVITSIFFGIFHFDLSNLFGPILLGLLIGYYVLRTNSIFAGMLAHFCNNAIAEILSYIVKPEDDTAQRALSAPELFSGLILGFILLGIIIVFLLLFRYITRNNCTLKPSRTTVLNDIASIISHWPIIIIGVLYGLFSILYLITVYQGTP